MAYPNLTAEMTRRNIKEKDLAAVVGRTTDTVKNWLNGKGDFPVGMALKVQEKFFPTYSIAYLFNKEPITLAEKHGIDGAQKEVVAS